MPRPILSAPRFFLLFALSLQFVSGTQAFFDHDDDDDNFNDDNAPETEAERKRRRIIGAAVGGGLLLLTFIVYLIHVWHKNKVRARATAQAPVYPISFAGGPPVVFPPATYAPPPGAPGHWAPPPVYLPASANDVKDNYAPDPAYFIAPGPGGSKSGGILL
ncbi:hypothetical protein C8R44DRAFT_726411 [Mycena epipterygia]|nr:hypothetical protein C8R44DRAFT_726411 [Mycena epipterygia]